MWLLEVFNIVYKGQIELKSHQQIGTIKVSDEVNTHYLYKVNFRKAEKRKPLMKCCDEFVLSGPNIGSISAKGSITVDIDLFCGAYKESFTFYNCSLSPYTVPSWPIEKKIKSKDGLGEICIMYAIFDNATEANIKIQFFTDDGYNPEVYGVVTASTSDIEPLEFSSMLFIKKSRDKIKVVGGKPFPLSRSIVAVPLGHKLFLNMHLMHSQGDFLQHTFQFQAERDGSRKETLLSKAYKVEVEVSWRCAHEPGRNEVRRKEEDD